MFDVEGFTWSVKLVTYKWD